MIDSETLSKIGGEGLKAVYILVATMRDNNPISL